MQQDTSFHSTLAVRERYRDDYWRNNDPIANDRLLWRAQAFRHAVHLFPGQTILELGCGQGLFTRALLRVCRGENPITAVTFQQPDPGEKTRRYRHQRSGFSWLSPSEKVRSSGRFLSCGRMFLIGRFTPASLRSEWAGAGKTCSASKVFWLKSDRGKRPQSQRLNELYELWRN